MRSPQRDSVSRIQRADPSSAPEPTTRTISYTADFFHQHIAHELGDHLFPHSAVQDDRKGETWKAAYHTV